MRPVCAVGVSVTIFVPHLGHSLAVDKELPVVLHNRREVLENANEARLEILPCISVFEFEFVNIFYC